MNKFTLNKPLSPLYPSEWANDMDLTNTHIAEYPNLAFFKHHMKTFSTVKSNMQKMPYPEALDLLVRSVPTMTSGDYEIIKNRVKNNLLKRGLISDTVYESYKYAVEGDIVDVAKVIAEDPECCLVPNASYTNYFYELYISVSYASGVRDSTVIENMAKILATVELLEREHIYCKITLVLPNTGCNKGSGPSNYLGLIPLFSHRDVKSIEVMSSVLNERLLRTFFFAAWESQYGSDLAGGYGRPTTLTNCIVPVDLDECDLCSSILDAVIVPGTR